MPPDSSSWAWNSANCFSSEAEAAEEEEAKVDIVSGGRGGIEEKKRREGGRTPCLRSVEAAGLGKANKLRRERGGQREGAKLRTGTDVLIAGIAGSALSSSLGFQVGYLIGLDHWPSPSGS